MCPSGPCCYHNHVEISSLRGTNLKSGYPYFQQEPYLPIPGEKLVNSRGTSARFSAVSLDLVSPCGVGSERTVRGTALSGSVSVVLGGSLSSEPQEFVRSSMWADYL